MKKYITKKEKGFVQISNSILPDPNISLKAKTVLAIMLSLPDNWDFSIEGISGKCKESKDCIAKAVNELIDFCCHFLSLFAVIPVLFFVGHLELVVKQDM